MEDKALSQDLEARFHGEDTEEVRLRRFLNSERDQFPGFARENTE